jgi:hypothetical protein
MRGKVQATRTLGGLYGGGPVGPGGSRTRTGTTSDCCDALSPLRVTSQAMVASGRHSGPFPAPSER